MRRIESQEVIDRKELRMKRVVSILLIFLMASSTVAFIVSFYGGGNSGSSNNDNNNDVVNYNGFEFIENQDSWQTIAFGRVITTTYGPKETENVIDFELPNNYYSGKPLYYVFNDSNIQSVLDGVGFLSTRVQEVCLENTTCKNENQPIKDCESNIIIFSTSEEINAYRDRNCIYLEAPESERSLLNDAFVFKSLGVQ